jgi:NAD(P)-dependent dehydrogenase (short-subunit alcohol dehydrogenase family)
MARLTGKVALISGGARGQGAVEAKMFTQEGAQVVFGDILDAEGTQVEVAIRAQGGDATYVHLNVTREEDWKRAVQTAESKYGKLDILVNNAGIAIHGSIEETSEDEWDRIMAINMKGVFLGTKYAIPAMRRASAARLSISRLEPGLHRRLTPQQRTRRPKVACVSSRKRRQCSTPKTTSGVTPCIRAPLIRRWCAVRRPIQPDWRRSRRGCHWADLGPLKKLLMACCIWRPMSLPL